MTKRYQNVIHFSRVKRRQVEVNFEGGDISSDASMLLPQAMDKHLGLTLEVHRALTDPRVKKSLHT